MVNFTFFVWFSTTLQVAMLNPSSVANETLVLALYATLSNKDIPQLSPTGAA